MGKTYESYTSWICKTLQNKMQVIMKTEVNKHWIWGNKSEQGKKVEAKCLVVVQSSKYFFEY
jgi:hypothetical protein